MTTQKHNQQLMKTTNINKTKPNEPKAWFRLPFTPSSQPRKQIGLILQLSGPALSN